ncbi:MAG: hypothetical protein Q8882_03990 [Bacillota bacterium]|nr:hypothetical protein [Bacillota bacterium]
MNKYLDKLRNNKLLYIILITGIVLLMIPSCNVKEKPIKEDMNYEEELETKMENTLSLIKGAGKVSVMITLSDNGTIYPATDVSHSDASTQEKNVSVSGELAVVKKDNPSVCGVVVVAEGANNAIVRENILNAVKALIDVPAHKVQVFKSN